MKSLKGATMAPHNIKWKSAPRGAARKKVAIVCAGISGYDAPLDDPTWEVWGLNGCDKYLWNARGEFRADRWFEIHDLDEAVCKRRRPKGFRAWLKQLPCPLYQLHGRKDNAKSLQFPLDRVIEFGRDYFGCTMAYQVGLALVEGFKTIGLFGAELNYGREALAERPTVEWWLGFAQGLGVKVVIPKYYFGLGNHPHRYASDQVLEREAVFEFCANHLQTNALYIASRAKGLA